MSNTARGCFPDYTIDQSACLILMFTYQRNEILQECVESMTANPGYPFRIWIVDNGNDDGTREYLLKKLYDGIIEKVIMEKRNWGIHYPLNQMKMLLGNTSYVPDIREPRFVFISNDDMIFEDNWLKECVEAYNILSKDYKVGVISPFHCRHPNGDYATGMKPIDNYHGYPISKYLSGNTWFLETFFFMGLPYYPTRNWTEGGDWYMLEEIIKKGYIFARTKDEMAHHHPECSGTGKFNRMGHW